MFGLSAYLRITLHVISSAGYIVIVKAMNGVLLVRICNSDMEKENMLLLRIKMGNIRTFRIMTKRQCLISV